MTECHYGNYSKKNSLLKLYSHKDKSILGPKVAEFDIYLSTLPLDHTIIWKMNSIIMNGYNDKESGIHGE